ncbi:MAG TPA: rRNA maturation RNase YbeY [Planctomycetaceae bacterium]|nr:rRNA maturation RNase YbeY [Planctomycetaceae bacterium]HRE99145.1 rRNA maturation RNase YbeY [Pirellulaceae bacterium]
MPESDIPNSPPELPALEIEWSDRQSRHALAPERFVDAARRILSEAGVRAGSLSLAVVDDDQMHRLNRRHLDHDWPTDVLSFLLDEDESGERIEGEVIVSADYASREALEYGWRLEDELLLYVVHGTLHLIGHDDHEDEDRVAMRQAEARVLAAFGLVPRWAADEPGRGDLPSADIATRAVPMPPAEREERDR